MRGLGGKIESFIFANLLVTTLLSVLAYGTVEPWSLALFELNALLLGVLMATQFVVDADASWRGLRLALPLFGLTLWGAIQTMSFLPGHSLDVQATRETVVKVLALAIYFVAALHTLRATNRRRIVLLTLTVFGFAVSLFAIIQRLTYNGKMYWIRPVSDYIAPYGPYGNYNHFAGFAELILPLPLAYVLFARVKFEQRLLWLFSAVIMAVAVVFSLSRGGLLAVGSETLALLLVAFFNRDRWRSDAAGSAAGNRMLLVGGLAVVLLLALWIGYEPLARRFTTVAQGAGEHSVVTRAEYWQASWRMFLDHPLTGVGLGAFPAVYPTYGRSSARLERLEQTHNDYLQLLTDAGLVGVLLGLWFLVALSLALKRLWRRLARSHSQSRVLIVGGSVALLGIALHSFLDFNLQIAANALLCLVVVALLVAHDAPQSHDTAEEF